MNNFRRRVGGKVEVEYSVTNPIYVPLITKGQTQYVTIPWSNILKNGVPMTYEQHNEITGYTEYSTYGFIEGQCHYASHTLSKTYEGLQISFSLKDTYSPKTETIGNQGEYYKDIQFRFSTTASKNFTVDIYSEYDQIASNKNYLYKVENNSLKNNNWSVQPYDASPSVLNLEITAKYKTYPAFRSGFEEETSSGSSQEIISVGNFTIPAGIMTTSVWDNWKNAIKTNTYHDLKTINNNILTVYCNATQQYIQLGLTLVAAIENVNNVTTKVGYITIQSGRSGDKPYKESTWIWSGYAINGGKFKYDASSDSLIRL